MPDTSVIYWIRNDLRLADNPALTAAVKAGTVIPVYIWSPAEEGAWTPGGASRAWLDASLRALSEAYAAAGSRLLMRAGRTAEILLALCAETGAEAVYASRRYEPDALRQEASVRDALKEAGIALRMYNGSLLNAPDAIATQAGEPYKVFTPYYRACLAGKDPGEPYPAPERIKAPKSWPASDGLEALRLAPDHPWGDAMLSHWGVGEAAALSALDDFATGPVESYPDLRDRPGETGTSRLSPHLHFGEVSPRQVFHAVASGGGTGLGAAREACIRQLYWREFAHHLLYYFPHTPEEPLKDMFAPFPWVRDAGALRRWQRGQTGYPFVDAGMRELWVTGWMHNRVRMVVASFLVKDLRIHWRAGADWFWDTLADANLANNTLGWQWVAGCGADAAPYFRVFNPITQGMKFDPEGAYVRRWVPELAKVPDKYLHAPWTTPPIELAACGVTLGKDYPQPMVDHDEARKTALAIYDEIKSARR
ncbi:MAG: deoxyribodipyrimidine photo-lyase [Candidatus Hydrogenedentes bacterium]|nr:deoxyribodipyrimidine photo-lyase [Candidatus Hydrogenedentota bacterium]